MTTRLCIRWNEVAMTVPCAVCGHETGATVGPAFFIDGDDALACAECCAIHAPPLVGVMRAWHDMQPDDAIIEEPTRVSFRPAPNDDDR
jgi:hypothetical protein